MQNADLINSIREIIHKESPDAKIILYGSVARGDARPESDIDLLILINNDRISLQDEEKIIFPLYLLELSSGIPISSRVMAQKDWENRPIKNPFYYNVLNEGIVL